MRLPITLPTLASGVAVVMLLSAMVVFHERVFPTQPKTSTMVEAVIGQMAPPIIAATLDGRVFDSRAYIGHQPLIVTFWVSGCAACREALPQLNEYYEKYGQALTIVAINIQEEPEQIRQLVGSDWVLPVVLDSDGAIAARYSARYSNTYYIIDRQGSLIAVADAVTEEMVAQLAQATSTSQSK